MAVAPKLPINSNLDKYVSLCVLKMFSNSRKQYNGAVHVKLCVSLFSSQDMLEVFEAIQGKFQQIQILTRRQKVHLKRFHGGNDPSNGNTKKNTVTDQVALSVCEI